MIRAKTRSAAFIAVIGTFIFAVTPASPLLGDQVGSQKWTDYEVSVDLRIEGTGNATLWGHLDRLVPCVEEKQSCWGILTSPDGYSLTVDSHGWWHLNNSSEKGAKITQIKSGYAPGWEPDTWHNLKIAFRGPVLSVLIDGNQP